MTFYDRGQHVIQRIIDLVHEKGSSTNSRISACWCAACALLFLSVACGDRSDPAVVATAFDAQPCTRDGVDDKRCYELVVDVEDGSIWYGNAFCDLSAEDGSGTRVTYRSRLGPLSLERGEPAVQEVPVPADLEDWEVSCYTTDAG